MSLFEKMLLVAIALIGFALGWSMFSEAAEFTVDERSLAHIGASAGAGFFFDSILIGAAPKSEYRKPVAFALCMGVGVAKEMSDAYVDYGDLTFDAVVCGLGMWIAEDMWLSAQTSNRGTEVFNINARW